MKRILLAAMICLAVAAPSHAQGFLRHFTSQFGTGFSLPVGATNDHAGVGGNFVAAAGPRFNSRTSVMLDFSYHATDLDALNSGGTDTVLEADMRLWSLTLNPVFQYVRTESFTSYVTGGYGVYNRTLQLTRAEFEPAIVCDDWWDICTASVVSGDAVIGRRSTYKGGFNVGTGVAFGAHAKFFVEARYHRMFTTNKDTSLVPITCGIRW